MVLLDVHTGLGPSGVDTLMAHSPSSSSSTPSASMKEEVESIFPLEREGEGKNGVIVGGLKAASPADRSGINDEGDNEDNALSGYELTRGMLVEDFCSHFLLPALVSHHPSDESNPSLLCVVQEIGTVSSVLVGKALIEESKATFTYSNSSSPLFSPEKLRFYRRRLKRVFCPESDVWRSKVIRRGMKVIQQAVDHLERKQSLQ